jgi:hypothetical protein
MSFVSSDVAFTATPGIALPEGSTTVPVMPPSVCCATAGLTTHSTAVMRNTRAESLLLKYTNALPPEGESSRAHPQVDTLRHCIRRAVDEGSDVAIYSSAGCRTSLQNRYAVPFRLLEYKISFQLS